MNETYGPSFWIDTKSTMNRTTIWQQCCGGTGGCGEEQTMHNVTDGKHTMNGTNNL